MSYSILYDKLFIKVGEDKFIPFVLAGDNNVYEGRRKRARSWQNATYIIKNKLFGTKEEIAAGCEEMVKNAVEREISWKTNHPTDKEPIATEETIRKKFGYYTSVAIGGRHTSSTSFGVFKGFYMKGCEKAKTIEEYAELDIRFSIEPSSYWRKELEEKGLKLLPSVYPLTTLELLETFKKYVEYYKEIGNIVMIRLINEHAVANMRYDEKRANSDKRRAVKRTKQAVKLHDIYVLRQKESNVFFVKKTRNGYRYVHTNTAGKLWATEKAANKALEKLGYLQNEFEVAHYNLEDEYVIMYV